MKPIFIALLLAGAVGLNAVPTESSGQGQSYIGVIEAVVDGQNVPLERASATMESAGRFGGLAGMDMYWKYEGARSPVRFRAGQKIAFVVRVASADIDPSSYLTLSGLVVKHKERRLIMASRGIYGGTRVGVTKQQISVNYTPLPKGIMRIGAAAILIACAYLQAATRVIIIPPH